MEAIHNTNNKSLKLNFINLSIETKKVFTINRIFCCFGKVIKFFFKIV